MSNTISSSTTNPREEEEKHKKPLNRI